MRRPGRPGQDLLLNSPGPRQDHTRDVADSSSRPSTRRRSLSAGGGLVVGVLILVAFFAGATPGWVVGHTLYGTFELHGEYREVSTGCTGTDVYDDIREGAAVVVMDDAGKTIGTSSLGPGRARGGSCVFPFTVAGLPDANDYQVDVSRRGAVACSRWDLVTSSWEADLVLGD